MSAPASRESLRTAPRYGKTRRPSRGPTAPAANCATSSLGDPGSPQPPVGSTTIDKLQDRFRRLRAPELLSTNQILRRTRRATSRCRKLYFSSQISKLVGIHSSIIIPPGFKQRTKPRNGKYG